ncbi:hypothetical protein FDECE_16705 [Fusarium decemcellulare]|nr:hypothetical protein FDECE_16705 [Fusarium decemcellulare]
MDPASAIGTTSACIAFFQFTYGFLKISYELYDSGSPSGYEEVELVARDLNDASARICEQSPSRPSQDHVALLAVANRCRQLSRNLLHQIESRKGDTKRLQFALKGAFKLLCNRDVISSIQKDLERCQAQFHLRLTLLESEKIQDSLKLLEEASEEFRKQQMQAQEKANQRNIVRSLKFEVMDERYEDVSRATDKTFEWIMNDSVAQLSSNRDLRHSFRDWLSAGQGIFHISGKPGSGKSTLMKFLCDHPVTTTSLTVWASDRQLVISQFFFWKGGDVLQRTIRGLIRSILCSIVEKCPQLIPEVLPQFWDPGEYDAWGGAPVLDINGDSIVAAFDTLVTTCFIPERYAFCFFIDGLDEFEDPHRTHGDLVSSLQSWVAASPATVKICASSREWPAFLNRLPNSQRLRLQDMTMHDIETVVQHELGKEEQFQKLLTLDAPGCRRLQQRIMQNAEGVFLWVTLTLRVLRQALENLESLEDLERKLNDIPLELEAFYSYILSSIPKADRRRALFALAFTVQANDDSIVSNEIAGDDFTLFRTTSLLRYSFLSHYAVNSDWAQGLNFRNMTRRDIRHVLDAAATQIYGHCKGLLEVRKEYGDSGTVAFSSFPAIKVVIMHTSILDFVKDYLNREAQHLQSFNYVEACIQTFTAVVKSVEFNETHIRDHGMFHLLKHVIKLVQFLPISDKTSYIRQLDVLDEALSLRQSVLSADVEQIRWLEFCIISSRTGETRPLFSTLLHTSIYEGFHEYVEWKIESCPELLDAEMGTLLLEAVVDGIYYYQRDLTIILRELLVRGLSPGSACITPDYGGLSVWELHATRLILSSSYDACWGAASTETSVTFNFGRRYVPPKHTSIGWGERHQLQNYIFDGQSEHTLLTVLERCKPANSERLKYLLHQTSNQAFLVLPDKQEIVPESIADTELPSKMAPNTSRETGLKTAQQTTRNGNNLAKAWNLVIQCLMSPVIAWLVALSVVIFTLLWGNQ